MTGITFEGNIVSSGARTSRSGGGKARAPVDMRELLKSGRWSNGDPLSSSDAYEIARRLKPGWTHSGVTRM